MFPGSDPRTTAPSPTAQLVVYFLAAIKEVLSSTAGLTVSVGTPSLKTTPSPTYDVSGIIAFSGPSVCSMSLSFPMPTAVAVVNGCAHATIDPNAPEFAVAIGDLATLIARQALSSIGANTTVCTPNIILGNNHSLANVKDISCLVIPCQTPAGNFVVEVNIKI